MAVNLRHICHLVWIFIWAAIPVSLSAQPIRLVQLRISPAEWTFSAIGQSKSFQAEAVFSDGSTIAPYEYVIWGTSDTSVATVDSQGNVTARGLGTASIRIEHSGSPPLSASVPVTVDLPLLSLRLEPASLSLSGVGRTAQFNARATFFGGSQIFPYTDVTWSSTNEGVATVDETGRITTAGAGTTAIQATANSNSEIVASAQVFVSLNVFVTEVYVTPQLVELARAGETEQLIAGAILDDQSRIEPYDNVIWSSADSCVAVVSADGLTSGTGAGQTTITARVPGTNIQGSSTVIVGGPRNVDSLEIIPGSYTFTEWGRSKTFRARATFCQGDRQDPYTLVDWRVGDSTIARVNSNGVVTSMGNGTTRLYATSSEGQAIEASIEITVDRSLPDTPSRFRGISTRGWVGTDDNVMIGGIIVDGDQPKNILFRGIGPAMEADGVPNVLADPVIDIYAGSARIASNDNWEDSATAVDIAGTIWQPEFDQEAALLTTLQPGPYTVILSGAGGIRGNGLVEIYEWEADLNPPSTFQGISTRGWVGTGDDVMIAGFIIEGEEAQSVVIRGIGPELADAGVPEVIADPVIQIFSGQTLILENDDWEQGPNADQLRAGDFEPVYTQESAVVLNFQPGEYTVILSGKGAEGNGLIEVYEWEPAE